MIEIHHLGVVSRDLKSALHYFQIDESQIKEGSAKTEKELKKEEELRAKKERERRKNNSPKPSLDIFEISYLG